MKNENERTTVNLTAKAQEIKKRLTPAFGLKGILSVGLELIDKLSDTEKINRVRQAISEDKAASVVRKARSAVARQQQKERSRSSRRA